MHIVMNLLKQSRECNSARGMAAALASWQGLATMSACAQGTRPPAALKMGLQRSGESSLHISWHTACTIEEPCDWLPAFL